MKASNSKKLFLAALLVMSVAPFQAKADSRADLINKLESSLQSVDVHEGASVHSAEKSSEKEFDQLDLSVFEKRNFEKLSIESDGV
jgi:hypothetical protein